MTERCEMASLKAALQSRVSVTINMQNYELGFFFFSSEKHQIDFSHKNILISIELLNMQQYTILHV